MTLKKPKVLITGGKGQLGQALFSILSEEAKKHWHFPDVEELDITSAASVTENFSQHQPDVVINCAAYTAVDKAESEQEKAMAINRDGAANLANACQFRNALLVHLSTDFVFDGKKNTPLLESDPTAPLNFYGESKLAGELEIVKRLPRHIIIRTAWLYSEFGHNFMKTMLRLGKERDKLTVVFDQVGTPTYATDLAKAIHQIIQQELNPSHYGIYHFSNEGVASWYDFAHHIFELAGMKVNVAPVESSAYPTPATRPAFSVMNKEKIKKAFSVTNRHWATALADCLKRTTN